MWQGWDQVQAELRSGLRGADYSLAKESLCPGEKGGQTLPQDTTELSKDFFMVWGCLET